MLTVIRILAPASQIDELRRVIGEIDARSARGDVEWRAARGDGYFVVLCDGPSWAGHVSAILGFVDDNRATLALANDAGATLTVDTAVGPEDVDGRLIFEMRYPEGVLEALASVSAQLVVSLYALDRPRWAPALRNVVTRVRGRAVER